MADIHTILGDNPIKFAIREQKLKNEIISNVMNVPLYIEKKHDIVLLNYVMNLIELGVKKKYKIDKLQMLMAIYIESFGILDKNDIDVLKKNTTYLLSTNAVVKFTAFTRLFYKIKSYFRSQI